MILISISKVPYKQKLEFFTCKTRVLWCKNWWKSRVKTGVKWCFLTWFTPIYTSFLHQKNTCFFNTSWHHVLNKHFYTIFTQVFTTFNTCFYHFTEWFCTCFHQFYTWTAFFHLEKIEIFKLFSWLATYFKHVQTRTKHTW